MLVVKIELHSAITGNVTEIGRMIIANDGHGDHERGHYIAKVARRGVDLNAAIWRNPLRTARVENYPRLTYTVWELVRRALNAIYKPKLAASEAGLLVPDAQTDQRL